ncbi:MAG: DUF4919 domain-containing protein [Chlorobi bacterium]|nr:DUF4919 domain-containing protein [Chlorobiota bacterium]
MPAILLFSACRSIPEDPMQRRLFKHYYGKGTLPIAEPEYDSIWTLLQTDSGIILYEELFLDYLYGDTLSLKDARLLYFGYPYTARYLPVYPAEPYLDSAISLIFQPDSTNRQWQLATASSLLDSILFVDPFNLEALFLYMTLCDELNDSICVEISIARMSNVINAIMSSGTGRKPTLAIDIVALPHIDNTLFFFALPEKKRTTKQWKDRQLVKVKLKPNTARIKKMYYDITPIDKWLNSSDSLEPNSSQ